MACQRCQRWQRHMRLSGKINEKLTSRPFTTSSQRAEETTPASKEPGLSILEHKRRPLRIPNAQPRSPIHSIDVSQRLGTKYSAPVIGAMEWQTSTYHYNKQTTRTYPVLTNTTNRLFEQWAQFEVPQKDRDGNHDKRAAALRRKEADKVYLSNATMRDYGSKMVVDVFVHDSKAVILDQLNAKTASRPSKKKPTGPGRKRYERPHQGKTMMSNQRDSISALRSKPSSRASAMDGASGWKTLKFGESKA